MRDRLYAQDFSDVEYVAATSRATRCRRPATTRRDAVRCRHDARVTARARTREDRAGDPLDGLVNLFDLGIVLAVAFLLAALSSVKLTPDILGANKKPQTAGRGGQENEEAAPLELKPGERVVGRGERIGTVYRLEDGRTIIVRPARAAARRQPHSRVRRPRRRLTLTIAAYRYSLYRYR